MKDCEKIEEILGDWLDGELSLADSDAVRDHVTGCADCRAAQWRLEKMNLALRDALISDVQKIEFESFWRALERRIEAKASWSAPIRNWAGGLFTAQKAAWAVPAAIVAVLGVVSVNFYFTGWRGGSARNDYASVDSIDAHGRSVALLREDDTHTMVIWLYQNQEGENEAAEQSFQSAPAF